MAFVAAKVMEHWQPRIQLHYERMDEAGHREAMELNRQMLDNITVATKPWQEALANLPRPPVTITMDGDRIVRIDHG